ncbi:hypothetical protein [Actinoplanes teichomyceticus]|uniref:Uncharacterized protein n=1 Tax=Actinoplanes teichomyceticus TaxID=1867 RepID=A0A561WB82_ACTTI|nr:hypothetical protein [Actinoplanes teichomyceticus]TWG21126.1 hypothetical protein FHX34_103656 [Actinoplanes teichomyceticus]GIF14947.1 hypothetical protein Ate01nite_49790 [Actinoplanes teichomyceticus]
MADENATPDRVSSSYGIPVPIPGPVPVLFPGHAGAEMDNVYKSHVPEGVVAGANDAGARTEWDATSLQNAIGWLEAHGKWLNDLSVGMADIKDLMGGDAAAGGKSPLGGFAWAKRLAEKHTSLYGSTETAIKKLSDDLYAAARALKNVKDNYDRAEERNALTAMDMQKIFADVARSPYA